MSGTNNPGSHSLLGTNYIAASQYIFNPDISASGMPGTGIMRYNGNTGLVEISNNGSAFATIGTGSASTFNAGTNIAVNTVGSAVTISTVSGPTFNGTTTLSAGNTIINQAYDGVTGTIRAPTTNSIAIGNASGDTVITGSKVSTNNIAPGLSGNLVANNLVIGTSGSSISGGLNMVSGVLQVYNGSVWSSMSSIVTFNTSIPTASPTFTPNRPADPACLYVSTVTNVFWYYLAGIYYTAGSFSLTIGTINTSSTPNACTFSGGILQLSPTDGINPGIVTTGAQTIAGVKTLTSSPQISTLSSGEIVYSGTSGVLLGQSTFSYDQINGIVKLAGIQNASNATLQLVNSGTSSVQYMLSMLAASTPISSRVSLNIGVDTNNYDNFALSCYYVGPSSISNRLDIMCVGVTNPLVSFLASGSNGIGTITPRYPLEVVGSILSEATYAGTSIFLNTANPSVDFGTNAGAGLMSLSAAGSYNNIINGSRAFNINTSGAANAVYVSGTSGYVGIGNTICAYPLDIRYNVQNLLKTTSTYSGSSGIITQNLSTATNAISTLTSIASDNVSYIQIGVNSSGVNGSSPSSGIVGGALDTSIICNGANMYISQMNTTLPMYFTTGSTSSPYYNIGMTLTNAGYLGIGTTSPVAPIHVNTSQLLSATSLCMSETVTNTASPYGTRSIYHRINTTLGSPAMQYYGWDTISVNTKSLGYAWQQSNNSQASYVNLLSLDYAGNTFSQSGTSIPLYQFGNMGINCTSSPLNILSINSSSSLTQISPAVTGLTVQGNSLTTTNSGISVVAGTAGNASINFGDSASYRGSLGYANGTNILSLSTTGTLRTLSSYCALDIIPFSDSNVYMRTVSAASNLVIQGNAGATTMLNISSTSCTANNLVISTTGVAATGALRMLGTIMQYYNGTTWVSFNTTSVVLTATCTYTIGNVSGTPFVSAGTNNNIFASLSSGNLIQLTCAYDGDISMIMTQIVVYPTSGYTGIVTFSTARTGVGIFVLTPYNSSGAAMTLASLVNSGYSFTVQSVFVNA